MPEKIVLAYSGGLDTTVAVRWLTQTRGFEVIALTVDLGSQPKLEVIRERALAAGAVRAYVLDGRTPFVERFCWPPLKVLAPLRDGMAMTREQEVAYASANKLPIEVKPESPYSVDENLWGRSIEAGILEDALLKPPEDAFVWTSSVDNAPANSAEI